MSTTAAQADTTAALLGKVLPPSVTRTVDPVVDAVAPVTDPVVEATAPVTSPVVDAAAPVTKRVNDAVDPAVAAAAEPVRRVTTAPAVTRTLKTVVRPAAAAVARVTDPSPGPSTPSRERHLPSRTPTTNTPAVASQAGEQNGAASSPATSNPTATAPERATPTAWTIALSMHRHASTPRAPLDGRTARHSATLNAATQPLLATTTQLPQPPSATTHSKAVPSHDHAATDAANLHRGNAPIAPHRAPAAPAASTSFAAASAGGPGTATAIAAVPGTPSPVAFAIPGRTFTPVTELHSVTPVSERKRPG